LTGGGIGRNVDPFCAAEGLAPWFRGPLDRIRHGQTLILPAGKFITGVQSAGDPERCGGARRNPPPCALKKSSTAPLRIGGRTCVEQGA